MDPVSIIGVAASVLTLADTAFKLSKTLYTFSSELSSASEEIHELADDLEDFSNSLKHLSKLLNDSSSWFSDEIHHLTIKIIQKCAKLYEHIDQMLTKLGSKDKSTWKLKVKFIYKDAQIKKLMKRLQSMKSSLATILMSLQIELGLSLLQLSSTTSASSQNSSYSARSSKKRLEQVTEKQPNAVHTLIALPKRTLSETDGAQAEDQGDSYGLLRHAEDNHRPAKSPRRALMAQPAAMAPANASTRTRQTKSSNFATGQPVFRTIQTRSLKASSSIDSFKSALSTQQSTDDSCTYHDVKAIRNVLHAFKTAIDNLSVLIKRRFHEVNDTWREAVSLQQTLAYHERTIREMHDMNCKNPGLPYLETFNSSKTRLSSIEDIAQSFMAEVATGIQWLLPDHVQLKASTFTQLAQLTKSRGEEVQKVMFEVAEMFISSNYTLDTDISYVSGAPLSIHPSIIEPDDISYKHKYDPDDVGYPNSPPLQPVKANLQPTATHSFKGPLPPLAKHYRKGFKKTEAIPSQSDAGLVSMMEKGAAPEISYMAGKITLADTEIDDNEPSLIAVQIDVNPNPMSSTKRKAIEVEDFSYYSDEEVESSTPIFRTQSPLPLQRPKPADPVTASVVSEYLQNQSEFVATGNEMYDSLSYLDSPLPTSFQSPQEIQLERPTDLTSHHPHQVPFHLQGRSQSSSQQEASDSEETFVYESNPPEPVDRHIRYHSRTPSATSMASQIDQRNGPRSAIEGGHSVAMKKSMKFANSFTISAGPDSTTGGDDGKRTARSTAGTGRGASHHHHPHIGRSSSSTEVHESVKSQLSRLRMTSFHAKKSQQKGVFSEPLAKAGYVASPIRDTQKSDPSMAIYGSRDQAAQKICKSFGGDNNYRPLYLKEAASVNNCPELQTLWWTAYIKFRSDREMLAVVLATNLESLGFGTLEHHGILECLTEKVKNPTFRITQSSDTRDLCDKIIKAVQMVDERMGLDIAIVGWSCVWKMLELHENLLGNLIVVTPPTKFLLESLTQLTELTSLIARYAVMENLYHKSPDLTLKSEYRDSLFVMCKAMLMYFGNVFEVYRGIRTEMSNGGANQAVFTQEMKDGLLEDLRGRCRENLEEVRALDVKCRGFRVEVDGGEEDSESDDVIEDEEEDEMRIKVDGYRLRKHDTTLHDKVEKREGLRSSTVGHVEDLEEEKSTPKRVLRSMYS